MAGKKQQVNNDELENNQEIRQFQKEAELIVTFGLKRITTYQTPLMQEWTTVENPVFNVGEQYIFDKKSTEVVDKISGWSEEDLKMKFVAHVLELGHLEEGDGLVTFFDKIIEATVEGIKLKVKADFMMVKGLLNLLQLPYFHFHEYKPELNPTGEPMAQLLQSFLIAQVKNKNAQLPLYGVSMVGEKWKFVIMEGKTYCVSESFTSTKKNDLLKIIAILRKFRWLLDTRLRAAYEQ